MSSYNFPDNFINDLQNIQINIADHFDFDEPFLSIYRKEKISLFFKEILINSFFVDIFGVFLTCYLLGVLPYFFFMSFWLIYDWGYIVFLLHHLSHEHKY